MIPLCHRLHLGTAHKCQDQGQGRELTLGERSLHTPHGVRGLQSSGGPGTSSCLSDPASNSEVGVSRVTECQQGPGCDLRDGVLPVWQALHVPEHLQSACLLT